MGKKRTAPPAATGGLEPFRTDVPARLDRLPWSRFHWLVVFALGASWAIDGLEVTLKGAVSGVLQEPATLHLGSTQIGAALGAGATVILLDPEFFPVDLGWRIGFGLGAALMPIAAAVEAKLGVRAERAPLESIAPPLSVEEARRR